ncbi:hypothetical protein F5884DRAFT_827092 [Xylogone sp. PMI_703]|nr:hypothetical protein F5884DRAFT_827092 [Xylogone sp. PMI_703]
MDNGSTEWVDGLVEITDHNTYYNWLDSQKRKDLTIGIPQEDPTLPLILESNLELNSTIIVDNTLLLELAPEPVPELAPESATPHGETFESTTPHGDAPEDIKGKMPIRPRVLSGIPGSTVVPASTILTLPLKAKSSFESDTPFEKSQSDIDSDSSTEDKWYDTKTQPSITVDPLIQQAQIATQKARVKMIQKYSKRHKVEHFKPGDIVAIRIPKEDRTSTDNRTLWGRILTEPHSHRYKIATQYGVLNRLMPTKDLGIVNKHLWSSIIIPETINEIALTTAAREASTSQRVKISCQCKGLCNTKRCRCVKEGQKCTIHCHKDDHDCGWLSHLIVRTEIALIEPESSTRSRRKRARADTIGNVIVVD